MECWREDSRLDTAQEMVAADKEHFRPSVCWALIVSEEYHIRPAKVQSAEVSHQ